MEFVVDLNESQENVAHRPARLYEFDRSKYEQFISEFGWEAQSNLYVFAETSSCIGKKANHRVAIRGAPLAAHLPDIDKCVFAREPHPLLYWRTRQ